MKRLAVTLLALALPTAPLVAEAQQAKKLPRIGLLSAFSPADNPALAPGIPAGTARARLYRRREHHHRVPMGRGERGAASRASR